MVIHSAANKVSLDGCSLELFACMEPLLKLTIDNASVSDPAPHIRLFENHCIEHF